ncbi:hypothetical protein P5706_36835 [Pseudomonas sp. ChxA]|jgi:hypothetical protein|uniref:Transmembrane protein n=2 Tax=Pseudomonas fluorescens group TaxID=136843 RepID=A4V6Q7_PSEFS|nr:MULTISPECIES: hypothetical protein [Pseudomonas]SBW84676.1 membrane protein [Pseudomonas veronii 1YdBTEX2]MBF6043495.1 hypothetical protein [Pseudomonas mucoides]MBJ2202717.1 hypothetical protein [Pseudomonas carnis]MBX9405697.1 hypothetical protein [Pseudomonas baetica]MDL2189744.1 hypothetical protein [Pseudomonas sp. ChxA]
MSDKYGVPLGYFNLLGRGELRASRINVAFIAVTVILTGVIVYLINWNNHLQDVNVELQGQRVMYGYPNAEGVFVSENEVPERHIIAFTSVFLDNFYNFTPDSSFSNANEALRLMSPRFRAVQEETLKLVAKQSSEQQITQVFVRTSPYKIETTPQGYIVTFQALRYRATLNTVFGKAKFNVRILMKPVKQSKYFEWAIVADDLQTQEIAQ